MQGNSLRIVVGVEGVEGVEASSNRCWQSESWRRGAIFSFSFGFRIFRGNAFKPFVDDQLPQPEVVDEDDEALEQVVDEIFDEEVVVEEVQAI